MLCGCYLRKWSVVTGVKVGNKSADFFGQSVVPLWSVNGCDAFPHAPGIIAVKVILHTLPVDRFFFLLDLVTLQAVGISELCFVKGFDLFLHPCFGIWDGFYLFVHDYSDSSTCKKNSGCIFLCALCSLLSTQFPLCLFKTVLELLFLHSSVCGHQKQWKMVRVARVGVGRACRSR